MTEDTHLVELMKRAQAGDRNAYEDLLNGVIPRVRSFVISQRRFLRSEDIDDLVHDILLSMHAARATYDPKRPFLPWLLGIARNRLADAARRQTRQKAHEVLVDEVDVTLSSEAPSVLLKGYHDPLALKEAIEAFPSGQRSAIQLLKLQGVSLKEAAGASGTSIGALKTASHRAMRALRQMLKT